MPDLKISQLPVATTPLAGTELVPIVQGGVTDRTTVAAFLSAGLPVSATTLSASGAVTLSGGTANGVLYLDGSKVATSGSALTFDGTTVGVATGVANSTSLQITGTYTTNNNATFLSFLRAGGAVAGALRYNDTQGDIEFGTTTSHPLAFIYGGLEQMRLTSTGLGIGTSSPGARLHVYGATATTLRVDNGDNTAAQTIALATGGTDRATLSIATSNSDLVIRSESTGGRSAGIQFWTGNTSAERACITSTGNVVAGGSVALATTATDGFLYVPTCAGTPTGTPTAITGMAPIVVDTTNNKMYFYSGGAWRDAGP